MKSQERDLKALGWNSLLEDCKCDSLIQEIEEHLIINNEPFLHKTMENVNCNHLLHFFSMDHNSSANDKTEIYLHLGDAKNIDFKIGRKRKHKKQTLDEYIYKDVMLTLVYF